MNGKHYQITFPIDRPIINILGEICWGFDIGDFEKKIGTNKRIVETLLRKLLKNEKEESIKISLNLSEVNIIKNALKEVEKEIEEWEFPIRIGMPLSEVKKIAIFND